MKKNYLKIIVVILLCWTATEVNAQWKVGMKGGWNWTSLARSNMGRIDETYSPRGGFFAHKSMT